MSKHTTVIVLAVAAILSLASVGPAGAKAPGANGRLTFDRFDPTAGDSFTYTMNADGSDMQPLLAGFTSEMPRWSPDGSEVAVVSGLGIACPPTCTGNTVIINPD